MEDSPAPIDGYFEDLLSGESRRYRVLRSADGASTLATSVGLFFAPVAQPPISGARVRPAPLEPRIALATTERLLRQDSVAEIAHIPVAILVAGLLWLRVPHQGLLVW